VTIATGEFAGASIAAGLATPTGNADESQANARLIAAAPELLAELRAARTRLFGHGPSTDPLYRTISAAIAKAEGKAP
jgi:hypothetical protein